MSGALTNTENHISTDGVVTDTHTGVIEVKELHLFDWTVTAISESQRILGKGGGEMGERGGDEFARGTKTSILMICGEKKSFRRGLAA